MLESTPGGGKTPYISRPKGYGFLDLFGLKTAVNFSLESTMVYEGTTGA